MLPHVRDFIAHLVEVHSALKSSGTSPNFRKTVASLKSPVAGSPVRLNAALPYGPIFSKDLAHALSRSQGLDILSVHQRRRRQQHQTAAQRNMEFRAYLRPYSIIPILASAERVQAQPNAEQDRSYFFQEHGGISDS